jgi:hypothetical protein
VGSLRSSSSPLGAAGGPKRKTLAIGVRPTTLGEVEVQQPGELPSMRSAGPPVGGGGERALPPAQREPTTPEPHEQPVPPPGRRSGQRRLRTVLIAGVAALATLSLGGVIVAYFAYSRVAEPDRGTPSVVVRQYVDAMFVERNKMTAARFSCGDPSDVGDLERFRADLAAREQRFAITINISMANAETRLEGKRAFVAVDLRIDTPEEDGRLSRSTQRWEFELADRSGWRVCNARRVQ